MIALGLLILAQATPGSISGLVVDAGSDKPVKRATVRIVPGGQMSGPWPRNTQVVTGANGEFFFDGLPAGQFQISADHPRYPPSAGKFTPVSLTGGEPRAEVRLKLTPAAIVSGRVIDDNGEPAQAGRVNLVLKGGSGPPLTASVDDRGEFRIFAVPAGQYVLEVQAGRPPLRPRPFGPRSEPEAQVTYAKTWYPSSLTAEGATVLTVEPGGQLTGIEAQLVVESAVTVSGRIAGMDIPPGERPIINLIDRRQDTPVAFRSAMVQPDGQFRFVGVPPGSYRISSPPGTPRPAFFVRQDIEIKDQPMSDLSLRAQKALTISARFDPPESGRHSAFVALQPLWSHTAGPIRATPGDDERVLWFRDIEPGEYAIMGLLSSRLLLDGRPVDGQVLNLSASGELVIGSAPLSSPPKVTLRNFSTDKRFKIVAVPADARAPFQQFWIEHHPGAAESIPGIPPGRYRVFAVEGDVELRSLSPRVVQKLAESGVEVEGKTEGAAAIYALTPISAQRVEELAKSSGQ